MDQSTLVAHFLAEFNMEVPATAKCLERIPESLYKWKPHEKSMDLGYLTLLVAEIPNWIAVMIEKGVIDFQTFQHSQPKNTMEMNEYFHRNVENARQAFRALTAERLSTEFVLRNGNAVLMKSSLEESISSTINHWVHHRGQLTLYMRLNDIAVPSIYGPSADEKTF